MMLRFRGNFLIFLILFILLLPTVKAFPNQVPILMYHHIRPVTTNMGKASVDLSCEPKVFIQHLDWLERNGYRTVLFKDIRSGNISDKVVILTFDDGSNSQWFAFNELKKREMVGVFFIVVNHINKENFLNYNQIQRMAKSGMEIGSHTLNHPFLIKLPLDGVNKEIKGSKSKLENMFGVEVISFAYPYGVYNKQIIEVVKYSGYHYGRATHEKISDIGREKNFETPIVYIHNSTRDLQVVIK